MKKIGYVAIAGVRLLPMPKLSPSMLSGTVQRWLISPGTLTKPYQLVLEISTESLLKIGMKKEVMDVEIIEDLYLSKILVKEGQSIKVGSPLAIFCEEESDIDAASQLEVMCNDSIDSGLNVSLTSS